MSQKETNKITKENWISNFNLIGQAKVNEYTFKTDEKKEGSSFIYNSMYLGVDCGEKSGIVACELMGGYTKDQDNVIYVHGKKEDGSDDFSTKFEIDWNDRFNEDILNTVGDLCFITVGLEKTDKDKTYYKKFLSPYDAIEYIAKHLENDSVINVRGNLKYSLYNDKVQIRKNVTSIVLSKVEDSNKYAARFTQTILIDKDSASLKNIDKDKNVMYVDAKVLDYIKEFKGVDISGQFPYSKQFEFEFPDLSNAEQCQRIMDALFKVKKGYTQITFEGELVESGAAITVTLDDIPKDIKDLIALGLYSEEEALTRCSTNGSKEQRMILRKPMIKMTGEDKIPVPQIFTEKYSEEDLIIELPNNDSDEENVSVDESPESVDVNDLEWLKNLT